ncbi:hypothetical protein VaNZ11_000502 [Volvox africanus]|uniref:FPL domain-containing protein n=1 Tax=Volvox africanus TaxID=51714 RepID=A0ABQ5RNR4_9CHLO|nr:hypothetical protein VaNZ11_000502 [Volvox africanus]
MFESFLRKNFWQSLFTGTAGSGRTRFTFEELRALSDVLNKNQVVTEANRALVVETIRSIAEFMIWGDQNEPRIFDYFLENNIMHYLHRVLQQPANRTGDVAKQVLQTLSIIIQNIRSETGTYFLFSNNHINNIVEIRFDFDDEEVLGYYISFLKTISLKLNARTVQFFFDRRESECTFPLYSEAVKFAHHKEGMVRAGVRTLTLNVYSVPDEHIQDFVCQPPATAYFAEMAGYISDQIKILDKRMTAAEGFSAQVLSSLDSQLAEVEDMVSYVADILTTAHPRLAHLVAEQLWVSLIGPFLLRPLLEYGSRKSMPLSNSGPRRTSASGTAPSSPGPAGSPSFVRATCSLYCLERLFVLIAYTPLLHNLALAMLEPRNGYPSCRSALVSVLHSSDHRAVPAALRCLVAIMQNHHIAPEVLALLGIVPRSRASDLHEACTAGACAACQLHEDLLPVPERCLEAGSPPDPVEEAARPVATVATGIAGANLIVFGYHLLWTHLEEASKWVLAQQELGDGLDQNNGAGAGPYSEALAGDLGSEAETKYTTREADPSQVRTQDLLGDHLYAPEPDGMTSSLAGTMERGSVLMQRDVAPSLLANGASETASGGDFLCSASDLDVDLLGMGNAGSPVMQVQPAFQQPEELKADLLGLDDMPASVAAPVIGTRTASTDRVGSSTLTPIGVPKAGRSGALADLLDVDHDVAMSAAASDLTVLTGPNVKSNDLLGAALGPINSSSTASQHLLDSLLEPSLSRTQQVTTSAVLPVGMEAGSQLLGTGIWEASQGAPLAVAEAPVESRGVGPGPRAEADAMEATKHNPVKETNRHASRVVASAGAPMLKLVESIGALDITPEPAMPGLQSAASSSDLGSACVNSSSTSTMPPGALADASASSIPPSVQDSSSWGPGQPEVKIDAAPSGSHQNSSGSSTEVAVTAMQPPPPPPAAPAPPPPAPAPLLSGPPCAAHARPVAVADSTDVLDALFELLSMKLLPVTGLWHVGHLLQELYPRAKEQHDLNKQQQQTQQLGAEAAGPVCQPLSSLLASASCTVPEAGVASPSGFGLPQAHPNSLPHPLDPGSTAGWACELNSSQREALRVAAVSAASAVLDEVGGIWCDALVAMLVMEWPTAHDAVMRPVLRTGAEQLVGGPHLYPRQTARGPSAASRNDQGLGNSAVAALHSYHAVSRLVALLLVHDLLCKGTTERTPPPTVPPPAGTDVEGREWDVLEGQEVELQADSAIPCIVSFSPGQERRVYFAAAGPALRRVGEYLQNPQALLSDTGSQSVVLYSSPAVVLADPAPTRLNAGVVLSVSPLLGCDPSVNKNVAKWLHVHVRPSVRGLLRLLRSAAAGRKGGLLGALRHLVDGHWVLAFPDAERAGNARQLVEQSAHRLRALYCELLSPVLSTVME